MRCPQVFACSDGGCAGKQGSVRALRCQLPRENEHYSFEPPDYPEEEPCIQEIEESAVPASEPPAPSDAGVEALSEQALAAAVALKEEANAAFAAERYEEALKVYASALDALGGEDAAGGRRGAAARAEAARVHGNRAECFLRLEGYPAVLAECAAALSAEPAMVKCLLRRARANLALSRGGAPLGLSAAQRARADLLVAVAADAENATARELLRTVLAAVPLP